MKLSTLRALGFDRSRHIPFTRTYSVQCSCCAALVINGLPSHERGCENEVHECGGCNALIQARQRYCEDCA
jgi:hypothetical protein